jgi:pyruvate,orthophosphate dikinase
MSKKSKKKLKKKERKSLLKAAPNSRKGVKASKKAVKLEPARNGHAEAKAKKGKLVYYFGDGRSDGDGKMKALLGGKGANLAEMTRIGLPVPPGFTITTEVCTYFNAHSKSLPKEIDAQIEDAIARIEKSLGKGFGSLSNPLLFAVRSGARDSMPGMMDTILNLGLNDETVQGLIAASQNERFAYDCYRRFIQMYGDVVMGVQKTEHENHEPFEVVISQLKAEVFPGRPVKDISDTELDASSLKELVARFKKLVHDRTGRNFPSDPREQLRGAIGAVFGSWMNERAVIYRHKYNIPTEWGTAVNVQSMVFGNTGEQSCSGVAFTRDPATGEHVFYGEYLINAQGEDVVAGVRTPDPVATLQEKMPKAHKELEDVRASLEKHFREMQDFEFTVENGKLFMLQTRNGKRTGVAAVRIAVEMVKEKLITWQEAVARVPADQLSQLLTPIFDRQAIKHAEKIANGLPAGPGAATGRIFFKANEAEAEAIRGMLAAEGILTARGGVSSHAALVARQMGKVCVCGAHALHIDYDKNTLTVGNRVFNKGDYLSIDGSSGDVFAGEVKTAPSEIVQVLIDKTLDGKESATYGIYAQLMGWADKLRRLQIRTNADQPDQVANAVAFGAQGVGLCRTEHMFFEGDRIDAVREMILAEKVEGRKAAVAKLLPYQKGDFAGIFRSLNGLPATIRLLDPPLHEFLPNTQAQQQELADKLGVPVEKVTRRVSELHEFNPMLGLRGCRLGILFPEISAMQVRAIFEAAIEVQKEGIKVKPEIMIPLVGFAKELELQVALVRKLAAEISKEHNTRLNYLVGTMIEIPRACVVADEIAKEAEFFSFGTNDLTQTGLGMSRDDSGSFLPEYQNLEILKQNPFATIDKNGVGALMKLGIAGGRKTRPDIKLGICGEHGGDPASVKFCHEIGLTYVSCSPFRVPIARLAAAQAALADAA